MSAFHHDTCGGKWESHDGRPRCTRCGLRAVSLDAVALVDPQGYVELVDPDGTQRAFLAATGLVASLPVS